MRLVVPRILEPYLADSTDLANTVPIPVIESPRSVSVMSDVLHPVLAPALPKMELMERADQGASAMQMPERLVADPAPVKRTRAWFPTVRQQATTVMQSLRWAEDRVASLTEDCFVNVAATSDWAVRRPGPSATAVTSDSAVIVLLQTPEDNKITIYEVDPPDRAMELAAATAQETRSDDDLELKALLAELAPPALSESDILAEPVALASQPVADEPVTDEPVTDEPVTEAESILPESISNLGDLAQRPAEMPELVPAITEVQRVQEETARDVTELNPASWPLTTQLNEQLESLASMSTSESNHPVSAARDVGPVVAWTEAVADRLDTTPIP